MLLRLCAASRAGAGALSVRAPSARARASAPAASAASARLLSALSRASAPAPLRAPAPPRRLLGGAAGSAVVVLNEETSSVEKETATGKTLVWYTAAWCGPCKGITPTVNSLSASHADAVRVLKVDIDECPDAAGAVSSVPTFRAFAGGKLVGELLGANPAKLTALVGDLAAA